MENTAAYVAHRLSVVGGSPSLIPESALETLFKLGRGRPRLMNTLADNALFEAYLAGRSALEPGDVERAAHDLGVGADPGTTFSPVHSPGAGAPPELQPAPESASPVAPSAALAASAAMQPLGLELAGESPQTHPMSRDSAPPPVSAAAMDVLELDMPAGEPDPEPTLEPPGEIELTSVMPEAPAEEAGEALDFGAAELPGPAIEVDSGFEAAIADLEDPAIASRPGEDAQAWEVDALDVEDGEGLLLDGAGEDETPDAAFELRPPRPSVAEITAESLADVDELDDVYVELIEE
jgi:hypothetical protein